MVHEGKTSCIIGNNNKPCSIETLFDLTCCTTNNISWSQQSAGTGRAGHTRENKVSVFVEQLNLQVSKFLDFESSVNPALKATVVWQPSFMNDWGKAFFGLSSCEWLCFKINSGPFIGGLLQPRLDNTIVNWHWLSASFLCCINGANYNKFNEPHEYYDVTWRGTLKASSRRGYCW